MSTDERQQNGSQTTETPVAGQDLDKDESGKEKWKAPKLYQYDTKNHTQSGSNFNPDGPSYS